MKHTFNLIFFLFLHCISCRGQVVPENVNNRDTVDAIIDPIERQSFNIKRKNEYVRLPDSLGGKDINGFAVLSLYINERAVIDSFSIAKLVTGKEGKVVIDYYRNMPLTREVEKFYPFFKEYLHRSITVKMDGGEKPCKVNLMDLMIRFK